MNRRGPKWMRGAPLLPSAGRRNFIVRLIAGSSALTRAQEFSESDLSPTFRSNGTDDPDNELNSIGMSLRGGVSELQWVVSTYTIAFAALILTAGASGDRLGAKRIFMAGFAVFTLASFARAMAPLAAWRSHARA